MQFLSNNPTGCLLVLILLTMLLWLVLRRLVALHDEHERLAWMAAIHRRKTIAHYLRSDFSPPITARRMNGPLVGLRWHPDNIEIPAY